MLETIPRVSLGEFVMLQRGHDLTNNEREVGSVPVLGGGGISGTHSKLTTVGPGVAIGRSGAGFGNAWWCENDFWAHNTILYVKDFKGNDPKFVYYCLDYIDFSSYNSGGAQPSLNRNFIRDIPVFSPPLPEQRRIAEILRTWDEAIEKLDALRTAKAERLYGIAVKLIYNPQTEHVPLRQVLTEVSQRNAGGKVQRVLSVTNSAGFVLASEKFAHRVASADTSNYKIVQRGQYAYNPSRINVGSIARLNDWDNGALSPMYVVFGTDTDVDSDYFGHWLDTAEARQRIAISAQGSVRETVSFGDLGSVPIPIPTLEKQAAIASALTAGREELTAIDKEITAFKRQKRGLMQKLLTGEWRVGVDDTNTSKIEKETAHG